ncbi:TraR/DksA family transcriptional regulator [uncultured Jatrophihabitans sp.]|uniref:TraR/DksA family transcriptional regulator n=1 Tax=uncultured Jatrophihabitans sp. TaxID=1610747 RepID=UPI0035CB62ED
MTRSTLELLTAADLSMLRGMLLEQRDFRLEQLAELRRRQSSAAMSTAVAEVSRSLIDGAQAALRDVHEALERMADGNFGACVGCGGRLERERLEILPHVARCMPCQQAVAAR